MSIYLGTSPLANTGYDKANTDLSNLTSQGKNIANWSNNVSNCITEIPQDIKLTLSSDGTLTLPVGVKYYFPNGADTFESRTTTTERTATQPTDGTYFVFINSSAYLNLVGINICVSGTTDSKAGQAWHVWYDTANNVIHRYGADATTQVYDLSLPIAIATVSGGQITSIDQVFNGFGYIGSIIFALPGVKGLIPNGRNADGTLKNIEFTIPSVKIFNFAYSNQPAQPLVLTTNVLTANKVYAYNEKINHIYNSAAGTIYSDRFICGRIATNSSSQISLLEIKTAFHAVDYNDFENLTIKVLKAVYPVGSCFIGTTSTCPLAALFGTWTLQSSGIVTSVNTSVPIKGTGKTLGITNGSDNFGFTYGSNLTARTNAYNVNVGINGSSSTNPASGSNLGVVTDASKSGIVGTVTRSTLSVNIWERTA